MRLHEILTPDTSAILHHPTCGWVRWRPEFEGSDHRVLVWATGPEKDRPLVVDGTVLFGDEWEAAERAGGEDE